MQRVSTAPERARLVERERELSVIARAIRELRARQGWLLVLEGDAGTGKTALLSELVELAVDSGSDVLSVRATERDASIPFGVARRLLHGRADEPAVAAALDQLDKSALTADVAVEGGAVLIDALVQVVLELAAQRSLVLAVDDAPLADLGTQRMLTVLARVKASTPLLLVVAMRNEHAPDSPAAALRQAPDAVRLQLAELSEAAVAQVVLEHLPTATATFVAACRQATDGNPLLLHELLTQFTIDAYAPDDSAAARVASLVPETVKDGVLVRLAGSGDDGVEVARSVAVLGDGAPLHQVAAVAGLDLTATAAVAESLVAARILTGHEALSYRHPLIGAAVLADAGPFRAARMHARAAALLTEHAQDEAAAAHLMHVTPRADPGVVAALRRAAASALRHGDAHSAASFLARALAEPPAQHELVRVLLDAAEAETVSGGARAQQWLEHALTLIDAPDARAEPLLALARVHHLRTEFGAAAALADRVFTDGSQRVETRDRARALWQLFAHLTPELQDSAQRADAQLTDELRSGVVIEQPEQLALLSLSLAQAYAAPREVTALAIDALERHVRNPSISSPMVVDFAAGSLVYMGALRDAERLSDAAHAAAVRAGSIVAAASAAAWRGVARLRLGDLGGADRDAEIAFVPERHGISIYTGQATALLAMVRLEQADVPGAQDALARAAHIDIPHPLRVLAHAAVCLAAGDLAAAEESYGVAGQLLLEIWGTETPVGAPWRSGRARALAARGQRETAYELAHGELELARRAAVPLTISTALQACASMMPAADAITMYQEAVDVFDGTEEVLEKIRARVELGAALRRSGQRRAARPELEAARDEAQRLHLPALAARASGELAASGARPRRGWATGPLSLTPTELLIARRAAAGETNGKIASDLVLARKTVEWHLANVYRKVGIAHRDELAAVLEQDSHEDV